jgi:ABC-type phosphate transport system auxiliary subunit
VLWVTFIVWLLVLGSAVAWVGIRGWKLARRVRATQLEVQARLDAMPRDRVVERLGELEQRMDKLHAALDRLHASLAELQVLLHALRDVRSRISWVRSFFTA